MASTGKLNYLRKPFKKLTKKKPRKTKVNSEIREIVLESDPIIENYSEQPHYNGLKADLETAVSHYLNQVKELGIYKDFSSRDNSCQFTTFKTPALPKKVIRIPPSPGDQLLDVKFQVTSNEPSVDSGTYENLPPESRGLDNPLYVSLSECSTGSSNPSLDDSYKSHPSGGNSDEDHIYENVEHHVYDTVSCPPRPKLPPKPNRLSKPVKVPAPKLTKKVSSLVKKPREIFDQRKDGDRPLSHKANNCKTVTTKRLNIRDGSETSDLGSSGSEDTSEEDWSLPPLPLEPSEELSEDIPLPPPPPELALQQLEERVKLADINKNIPSKNKPDFPKEILANNPDDYKNAKALLSEKEKDITFQNKVEKVQSFSDEKGLFHVTRGSIDKKQLKRKLFTLNKGLHVYNKVYKPKEEVLGKSKPKVSEQERNSNLLESPTVRHSVIIELKDSADPTSLQYLPETQIKERLVPLDRTRKNGHEIRKEDEECLATEDTSFSVNIKGVRTTQQELTSRAEDLNDQIIEIAEDGSWEMKTVTGCNETIMDSQTAVSNLQEIDPFTGLPLFATVSQREELVSTGKDEISYDAPEIYFDEKQKQGTAADLNENRLRNDVVFPKSTDLTMPTDGSGSLPILYSESITKRKAENDTKSNFNIDSKDFFDTSSSQNGSYIQKLDSLSFKEKESKLEGERCDDRQVRYDSIIDDDHKTSSPLVNIGTAIMEGYERDLKRVKENLNLPEVSLLEFRDSVKDLEIQRKNVIEQMTVKAKKKDSWIRTFRTGGTTNRETRKETVTDDKDPLVISNKKKLFENKQENFANKTNGNSLSSENKPIVESEEAISKELALQLRTQELGESILEDIEESLGKNLNVYHSNDGLGDNVVSTMDQNEGNITKGEVDSESILSQKEATKAYWKTKMLASLDDAGWEPVANVKFRPDTSPDGNIEKPNGETVPPPPEFSSEKSNSENNLTQPSHILSAQQTSPDSGVIKNERPSRQYVYGADVTQNRSKEDPKQPCPSLAHENIIEAEIRAQQIREDELRRENGLKNRDKTGGASSPSSHTSDEGFVDPPIEDPPSPALTSASPISEGFTHALKSAQGETIIYDVAGAAPSEYFTDRPLAPTGGLSETKIALEIRELKEREAELKAIRELREREEQLRAMRDTIPEPRTYGENETEVRERISTTSTPREILEDQLISLTTTTDEGNFSECGDPGSSEDKSSDGSNSRIMSPDFQSFGSRVETRQRKVTVKPFEDEEKEVEPVYTQMKKESVIEREIRLAREREEAFRKEKGIYTPSSPALTPKATQKAGSSTPTSPPPASLTPPSFTSTAFVADKPLRNSVEGPKRGVQHRLATTRIQQEIEETAQRERELRKAGKIKTLSEDTVDSKVTRLSDFAADHESSSSTPRPCSISSGSPFSSLNSSPSRATPNTPHSPVAKMRSSPITSPTPYSTLPTNHSPTNSQPTASPRLIRSFSTTNLSSAGTPGGIRPTQKGLMQKFIASRGKMTKSAFAPPSTSLTLSIPRTLPTTANGIPTRPMRVIPKAEAVLRRESELKMTTEEHPTTKLYRRTHTTAEEKIQEELRDMKRREEELRRLRAKTLARSQPNLARLDDVDCDDLSYCSPCEDGVDSTSFLPEVNGLRSALSNPNLLDDEPAPSSTQAPPTERGIRRRSALVAQWEGRIQQTTNY